MSDQLTIHKLFQYIDRRVATVRTRTPSALKLEPSRPPSMTPTEVVLNPLTLNIYRYLTRDVNQCTYSPLSLSLCLSVSLTQYTHMLYYTYHIHAQLLESWDDGKMLTDSNAKRSTAPSRLHTNVSRGGGGSGAVAANMLQNSRNTANISGVKPVGARVPSV